MSDVFDYIKFRGDVSFRTSPFNEADALLLSICSYLDFTDLIEGCQPMEQVAEKYAAKRGIQGPSDDAIKEECFLAMAKTKRYRGIRMENYQKEISEEEIKTYYALTFVLSWNKIVVAFPGTDKTILSWQENFTFLYKNPAPGQEQSTNYLKEAMKKHPFARVRIVGHSKGGNLSAFSAMSIEEKLQKRLTDVYLFDAPGFVFDVTLNPGFQRIEGKLRSFIPEESVVGRLFMIPYPNQQIIVSSRHRFAQHELISWQVGPYAIERGESLSRFSEITSGVINRLVEDVPDERREAVISEVFGLIRNNGINELSDLSNMKLGQSLKVMMDLPKISPEARNVFKTLLKEVKNAATA